MKKKKREAKETCRLAGMGENREREREVDDKGKMVMLMLIFIIIMTATNLDQNLSGPPQPPPSLKYTN